MFHLGRAVGCIKKNNEMQVWPFNTQSEIQISPKKNQKIHKIKFIFVLRRNKSKNKQNYILVEVLGSDLHSFNKEYRHHHHYYLTSCKQRK